MWYKPDTAQALYEAVRTGQSAVLIGGRGRGKTLLACYIGGRLIRELGIYVQYWRTADLLSESRHRAYNMSEGEYRFICSCARPWLLLLDEFQERTGRCEYERSMLARIIDHRYSAMRPTLILTNHTDMAEFAVAIGESVFSRLQETAVVVDFADWPDHRAAGLEQAASAEERRSPTSGPS